MAQRKLYLAILVGAVGLCGLSAVPRQASWRAIGAVQPRISPDGTTIAFAYQGSIWRVPREGGLMHRLTSGRGFDGEPAWSPDGREIFFADAFNGALSRIGAESGQRKPVPAISVNGRLQVHPDGKRLLGNFRTLAWLDLEKGTTAPVLEPPRAAAVFALSPDGARVAFATSQDVAGEQGGNDGPQMDVWIAEGGKAEKLVRFPSRIFTLGWAGEELLAASDLGGAHNDLWAIPLRDPEHPLKLTSGQADEDWPSVSADGRWLVHTDNREGATALVARDLRTGDERTVPISGIDFGAPAGTLKVSVVEKGTGKPLVARVAVREHDGKPHAPPGSLYRLNGDQMHFYCDRVASLAVPAGKLHVYAFRGIEYRMGHAEVEVAEGRPSEVRVELERWADPPARGWYDGENHIHANYGYGAWYNTPATMRLQIEGEGLRVANFVVANSDTDGIFDREFFRGRPDPVSTAEHVLYWNEEFRATLWGHMTLVNLKHLVEPIMTGFKDTTNPWDAPTNSDIADRTHLQGGHVNYTHPAQNVSDPYLGAYTAKSLPVDVALGKIDSIDVNASFEATVPLWHRLLNCGFRLPASAGTDCFLNRIRSRLPGSDRAYVKIDGPFSYEAWVKGLKAGRSFATNGPMLEFTAGGKSLGETIVLAEPGEVEVKAAALAPGAIDRVEILYNGTVVSKGEGKVRVDRSGWLGARAYSGRLQAHTSPIYVEVGGKPAASRADAEYFLAWIDRLEAQLRKRDRVPGAGLKAHVESQLSAARDVYRKVLSRSEAARGWTELVGEGGLRRWKAPTGAWGVAGEVALDGADGKKLAWKEGEGAIVNGKGGRTANLFTADEFGDLEAHVEFMVSQGSNSGVYFQGRYEIQILDSGGKKEVSYSDCGGIYQRWDPKRGKGKEGYEGHAPRANASKAPGEWQSFDVLFRAPRFDAAGKKTANARFVKVVHNGQVIHEEVEVTGTTRAGAWEDEKPLGPIMLQGDHGPVAFRNIRVRPPQDGGK